MFNPMLWAKQDVLIILLNGREFFFSSIAVVVGSDLILCQTSCCSRCLWLGLVLFWVLTVPSTCLTS
jgi:hypothetical protein